MDTSTRRPQDRAVWEALQTLKRAIEAAEDPDRKPYALLKADIQRMIDFYMLWSGQWVIP